MAEIIEMFPEERRLKILFSKSMEDLRRAEQRDLERSVRRGMEASAAARQDLHCAKKRFELLTQIFSS